jgi:hypothetical protein
MNRPGLIEALNAAGTRWLARVQAEAELTGTFRVTPAYAAEVLDRAGAYGSHTNVARNLAVIKSADGYAVLNVYGSSVRPGVADLAEQLAAATAVSGVA